MLVCEWCGTHANPEDSYFCTFCGRKIEKTEGKQTLVITGKPILLTDEKAMVHMTHLMWLRARRKQRISLGIGGILIFGGIIILLTILNIWLHSLLPGIIIPPLLGLLRLVVIFVRGHNPQEKALLKTRKRKQLPKQLSPTTSRP